MSQLLHTSLHVPNRFEECVEFYGGLLGLQSLDRPHLDVPGVWYAVGDAQIHLNARSVVRAGPTHPTHQCLCVSDLDEMADALQQAGHRVFDAGNLDVRQLWTIDPGGNVLEFQEGA